MAILSTYLRDFFGLFFPQLCGACGKNLYPGEEEICLSCIYSLPKTNFHKDVENKVAKQFWGRVPLKQAGAFLHFRKGTLVQHLLHNIKYSKRPELAVRMGELYGQELLKSRNFMWPDVLIAVPLHPRKLKSRGYNQSACLAEGLSQILGCSVVEGVLQRASFTETQTKKSRFARYENLQDAFELIHPEQIEGKHILLVDDVITTGATLEACALAIHAKARVQLSVCALAFAD
ncbi:MAG: ComF family protein [Sphingobacteriaceae bacterium]